MLLNISWCFLRVVMGKALFIWRQFMDDSHAPRRSSKTVKLFLDCLKPTFSLWLICMHIKSTSVSDTGGEIDCVDKDGNTPLHVAARYGHELLINTLITSGADCTRFDSVFGSLLTILVTCCFWHALSFSAEEEYTACFLCIWPLWMLMQTAAESFSPQVQTAPPNQATVALP